MAKLTPDGEKIVTGLAEQYKIGAEAVKMMLDAVARGGGTMAQFNVPEFGGSGQWMRGGMTMVGDMFNNSMKATVDNLCTELSNLMEAQVGLFAPMSQSQSQSQGTGGAGSSSYTWKSPSFNWWPAELGNPASTGSQNSLRYAYFPEIRRLAIDLGGTIEVYDTTGFNIQGFGQQQGGDAASISFTSQRGIVRLHSLPRVYGFGEEAKKASERKAPAAKAPEASAMPEVKTAPSAAASSKPAGGDTSSILALIEQLGGLKEKGLLTEEEFAAKKAELLKRL
ncbi:MAG: SHOCT domain-containing protein [Rhodomicrobium sp.]